MVWGTKYRPEVPEMPTGHQAMPPSSREDVDVALSHLEPEAWQQTTNAQRVQLLQRSMDSCLQMSSKFAEYGVKAHGSYGQGLGEEM
jgi:hypothetical protein